MDSERFPNLEGMAEQKEPSPEVNSKLVEAYRIFQDSFSPKADVVYYPSCGLDASATEAFPNSRIIYVDIDKNTVEILKKNGLEAYAESATEFKPDAEVNILIFLNPQIPPERPSQTVSVGGYVLCNNYHGTAVNLNQDKNFKFLGTVRADRASEKQFLDQEDIEDYWQTVQTDEEWRNAPSNFWELFKMDYGDAANIVEFVTGKKEDIVSEYKKIQELVRRGFKTQGKSLTEEENEKIEKLVDILSQIRQRFGEELEEGEDGKLVPVKPQPFDLLESFLKKYLPRKKGAADDIYIFRRVRKMIKKRKK